MGNYFSLKKVFFLRDELFWLKFFDIFYLLLSFTIWFDLTRSDFSKTLLVVMILLTVFVSFLFYFISGQYKNINKFTTSKSLYLIAVRNLILVLFISYFLIPINITRIFIPLSLLVWIFLTISMTLTRVFARDLTKPTVKNVGSKENICIYGAGSAGVLLSRALKEEGIYNVLCFVDESEKLWNREIDGIPILSPNFLQESDNKIKKVFLAIPSLTKSKTKRILDQ